MTTWYKHFQTSTKKKPITGNPSEDPSRSKELTNSLLEFPAFFCIQDDFTLNIHANFQWYFRIYRIYEVLTIASLARRQCFGTSIAKKEHSTWILSSTRFAFKSWNLNCYDCLSNSCGFHFLGAINFLRKFIVVCSLFEAIRHAKHEACVPRVGKTWPGSVLPGWWF